MKLLVDMNLSLAWVPFLSENGFQAVHWSVLGSPSTSDSAIMGYARANGFVVLTHDLDFGTLLAIGGASSPSVIQLRAQDILPDVLGTILLRSLEEIRPQLESGALVTIEPGRHRIRLLPI